MIHHEDLVRQIKHHVALALRPLELQLDGVELEGEIVAEGTEQADGRIFLGIEEIDDGAQHGEDSRNTRTFFLGENPVGLADGQVDAALRGSTQNDVLDRFQLFGNEGQEHFAALVIGFDPDGTAEAGNAERRIDDCGIPARVATRIFIVGRKDGAPALVQSRHVTVDSALVSHFATLAPNLDAAARLVGFRAVAFNHRNHAARLSVVSQPLKQTAGYEKSRLKFGRLGVSSMDMTGQGRFAQTHHQFAMFTDRFLMGKIVSAGFS